MKFYCDSCGAKYLIGDEKVRGKVLRIRCKKCDHVITVREPNAPAESGAVKQLQRKLNQRGAEADAAVWYYSVSGQTFGPMTLEDIREKFRKRELGDETYLWHETFSAWTPARDCDVVKDLFQEGAVRKPRSPTISLSTSDVRALAEKRAQELAQAKAGNTRPKVAASTGTSILKRATRNRSAPAASQAPQKPNLRQPLIRPGASTAKSQEVSPQDRIRALRERLRTNTGTQRPQGGSLRDRLRAADKARAQGSQEKPSLTPTGVAPGAQVLKPVSQAQKALVRPASQPAPEEAPAQEQAQLPEVLSVPVVPAPEVPAPDVTAEEAAAQVPEPSAPSVDQAAPEEATPEAEAPVAEAAQEEPEVVAPVAEVEPEPEAVAPVAEPEPEFVAPVAEPEPEPVVAEAVAEPAEVAQEEAPEAVAQSVDAPIGEQEEPQAPIAAMREPTLAEDDSLGIAAALEAAALEHEEPDSLGASPEEQGFFDMPQDHTEASALLDFAEMDEPSLGGPEEEEEDILNPSFTTTGMFTAVSQATPEEPSLGGLRPISAQAQEAVTREDSVTSASLLIQLNNLKKAQRKRQVMFAAAAAALLMVVGVTGFVLFTYFEDSRQSDLANEAAAARAKADRERKANKSNVDKRRSYDASKLGELSGDKPKAEPEKVEEAPVKEVAKANRAKAAPKNGMEALLGKGDGKLDRALASAGDTAQKGNALKRDVEGSGSVSRVGRLDHNPRMATPTSVLAGAARTRIEGRERVEEEKSAPQLPSTLDKAALAKGFKGVRRSVQQCVERHIKREGQLPKGKIKLGVTILKSGRVSAVSMDKEVHNTVFHSCMRSHRSRWSFPAFEGEPIQVRKSFVLQ